ncbi:alpha/beta hydrolase, partial [Patescibacteria group bacterium]|nr:alpha/beta hydrolase [Patescibacteria group bacterium]
MKPVLLCLHGWGGSRESFDPLREELKGTDIEIITPDLPGFGTEPEPDRPWSVDDYADWVESRMSKVEGRMLILGHSFGGRIAFKLAIRRNLKINHLFLCASAGIKYPNRFHITIGLAIAKTGNFFLSLPIINKLKAPAKKILYKALRVHDYEEASPMMKQTMIKVTGEDFKPQLSQITLPTDIFWGEDDKITPISDAHIINDLIKGSRLHTYPSVKHKVHKDKAKEIAD